MEESTQIKVKVDTQIKTKYILLLREGGMINYKSIRNYLTPDSSFIQTEWSFPSLSLAIL